MKKSYQYGLLILVVLVGAFITYPLWSPYLTPVLPPPGIDVIPVFKITNTATDAAFSAAPSVKLYDAGGLTAMPTSDLPGPMDYLDTLAETPDGEFTGTMSLPVGMWVYLYATDTNAWTFGGFYKIPGPREGTTGEAKPIQVRVAYNSGTITSDISGMLVSAGAEVDGQDATNNVTFGSASYRLDLTVAENYGFAGTTYIDPATGYLYEGGIVVLDLDLTTARCTVTGANIINHFTISSHEYWVLRVAQFINDADIDDDGTYSLSFTIDVSVGADDAMDVGYFYTRRPSQISQASFGTDAENNDDNLDNLNFATS
jgi:hypothetical protein